MKTLHENIFTLCYEMNFLFEMLCQKLIEFNINYFFCFEIFSKIVSKLTNQSGNGALINYLPAKLKNRIKLKDTTTMSPSNSTSWWQSINQIESELCVYGAIVNLNHNYFFVFKLINNHCSSRPMLRLSNTFNEMIGTTEIADH